MILTALFPAPRYLSKYSDSVSMRLYSLTLTSPRNSGFDLRIARLLSFPRSACQRFALNNAVHASRTTRAKPRQTSKNEGESRRQGRETFEITLIRGGEKTCRGFFCPEDLLVIKPNGRGNSPAISHRFNRRSKERGAV